jgi:hypothetical protein
MSRLVTSKSVHAPMMRITLPPPLQSSWLLSWLGRWLGHWLGGLSLSSLHQTYSMITMMMTMPLSPPCHPCHRRRATVALVWGLVVELAWQLAQALAEGVVVIVLALAKNLFDGDNNNNNANAPFISPCHPCHRC